MPSKGLPEFRLSLPWTQGDSCSYIAKRFSHRFEAFQSVAFWHTNAWACDVLWPSCDGKAWRMPRPRKPKNAERLLNNQYPKLLAWGICISQEHAAVWHAKKPWSVFGFCSSPLLGRCFGQRCVCGCFSAPSSRLEVVHDAYFIDSLQKNNETWRAEDAEINRKLNALEPCQKSRRPAASRIAE